MVTIRRKLWMNTHITQFKPVLILLYVTLACTIWKCFSIDIPVEQIENEWWTAFWLGTHKPVGAFLLFAVGPVCIVKFLLREKLSDYGIRLGIPLLTFRSFFVMSPFMVLLAYLTSFNPAFFEVYPFNVAVRPQHVQVGTAVILLNAVFYFGYYLGWEMLFRGFLQHGLAPSCGIPTAILIQTLASTMLHYGHPNIEVFASIAAGLVWGWLAVRTQSILSGLTQHTLLGIVLDTALILRE